MIVAVPASQLHGENFPKTARSLSELGKTCKVVSTYSWIRRTRLKSAFTPKSDHLSRAEDNILVSFFRNNSQHQVHVFFCTDLVVSTSSGMHAEQPRSAAHSSKLDSEDATDDDDDDDDDTFREESPRVFRKQVLRRVQAQCA